MYQDDLVCILKPEVKKGIVVWTHYTQPEGVPSLCESELKTGKQLHNERINFGRSIVHPYIFFRAPYYSRPIDYDAVDKEIFSSYDELDKAGKIFIRVDPDKTYVFSSEIRTEFSPNISHKLKFNSDEYKAVMDREVNKSKKTLSEYLLIINNNLQMKREPETQRAYHLYYSEAKDFSLKYNVDYPFDKKPINKNSEILVSIPHLTNNYFVMCDGIETNSSPQINHRRQ